MCDNTRIDNSKEQMLNMDAEFDKKVDISMERPSRRVRPIRRPVMRQTRPEISAARTPMRFRLPDWLDSLIYEDIGAVYCKDDFNMPVIDWPQKQARKCLGTYFPQSYAESYCIFTEYLKAHRDEYADKPQLSICDFGCGTGGSTMGLLDAIEEQLPTVSEIHVKGVDGDKYALGVFESLLNRWPNGRKITLEFGVVQDEIDDVYDLDVVTKVLGNQYDFVIMFKVISEFVMNRQFGTSNPYAQVVRSFLPILKESGIMCLADVTTRFGWEWIPHIIDKGIYGEDVEVISQNFGFYEPFCVTHSHAQDDLSKIAWRIIK